MQAMYMTTFEINIWLIIGNTTGRLLLQKKKRAVNPTSKNSKFNLLQG